MNEDILATLFAHPLGQLAITVVVAALTAFVTVRLTTGRPATPARAAPKPAVAAGINPSVVAAISAAVYAAMGSHRIVYIGAPRAGAPGSTWTSEMRTQHRTSHAVPRVHHSND